VGGRQHLNLPPDPEVVSIDRGNEVEQSRHHHKLGPVIRSDQLYGALAQREDAGDKIESSGPDVAGEAQHLQWIPGVGHVNLGLHRQAKRKHRRDGDKEQEGANPVAGQQVSGAWHEPAKDQRAA